MHPIRVIVRTAKNQRRRNLLYIDPFRRGRYFLEIEGHLDEGARMKQKAVFEFSCRGAMTVNSTQFPK
jgi:hypothetical protein